MVSIILAIIFFITSCVLGFVCYNLVKRLEVKDEENDSLVKLLLGFETMFLDAQRKVKELDVTHAFENDEEIGFIYKFFKEVLSILEEFFSKES